MLYKQGHSDQRSFLEKHNMTTVTNLKLRAAKADDEAAAATEKCTISTELGNGSQVLYMGRFISYQESWNYFDYLNKHIPWTRPTIRVFGRSCLQVSPLFFTLYFCFQFILLWLCLFSWISLELCVKVRFLTNGKCNVPFDLGNFITNFMRQR